MDRREVILECGGKRSATPLLFWCVISALFALLCACSETASPPTAAPEPPILVQAVHPYRGEIFRYIDLPGEVHPLLQATIFAKVDGYLAKLLVDKGDTVKEGDLLAEIEAPDLRANELKYKAELELAEAEFNQIARSPTNQTANLFAAEAEAAHHGPANGGVQAGAVSAPC